MLVRSSLMVSASQVGGQLIEVDVQDLCQPVDGIRISSQCLDENPLTCLLYSHH